MMTSFSWVPVSSRTYRLRTRTFLPGPPSSIRPSSSGRNLRPSGRPGRAVLEGVGGRGGFGRTCAPVTRTPGTGFRESSCRRMRNLSQSNILPMSLYLPAVTVNANAACRHRALHILYLSEQKYRSIGRFCEPDHIRGLALLRGGIRFGRVAVVPADEKKNPNENRTIWQTRYGERIRNHTTASPERIAA